MNVNNSKIWETKPRKFDDLIDQLLFNRGVISSEEDKSLAENFFKPDFLPNLHDPFLMTDMKGAATRIKKAIETKEKIGVYADYDADGVPGAALMYRALSVLGTKPIVYIPNRESGYGLSKEGIDYLKDLGCTLIITVDLGIRNFAESVYCKEVGVDLIITDHHLPDVELPQADFVVNPKRPGDEYPYKELSGCGVAYKVVHALSHFYPEKITENFLKWNLDLVAISTVCDVVPLTGENRILAKYGLVVIRKTKNLGIKELCQVCKVEMDKIGAYHIGFLIGPRINAPGRLDCATKSFELLVTGDEKEAKEFALHLDNKNTERQAEMDEIETESVKNIEDHKLYDNKIIILSGDWSKGVIGPTASRLVEKFQRPVILFSSRGETCTGSARSVSGVNIVELIEKVKELVLKYGGHRGAAGLSVEKAKFDKFKSEIKKIANSEIDEDKLLKRIKIDAEVKLSEMTFQLYEKIIQFEPFGLGNSRPVFSASDISFENFRFVGKNLNHFSAVAKNANNKIKTIYFSFPYEKELIDKDSLYNIAFNLNLEEWNGEKRLSLNITDVKTV